MQPELPENLAALSDDDLSALTDEFKAAARLIRDRDPDTLEALSEGAESDETAAQQILAAMTSLVESLEAIKAEQAGRTQAEETFATTLDELAARVGDEPAETTEDGDPEPEPVEEPEAVVASVRRPLPRVSTRNRPQTTDVPAGAALVASTAVYPHAEPGERLTSSRLADVMTDLVNKNRIAYGQKVVVASATYDFPADRYLDRDGTSNSRKIGAVTSPEALVASGGLCGPVTNVYSMPDVETSGRPVRDALAGFRADRGGANIPTNPVLTDYAEAVGTVFAADDALGGTYAVKSCMRIECPVFEETQVDSIYTCIEAGNLTARAYPELMARIDTLVLANQARFADGKLLDVIKAGSTAVTPTNTANAGGIWEFFYQVIVAGAGMRNRHRMSDSAVLTAILPEWLLDFLQVDIVRGQYDRFQNKAAITSYLRNAGISPVFTKDGPATGTAQVFGAQGAGALLAFPTDVQWALYPEGSWLHLDSGSLDLGIVRDSTLNSTNDFQIFAETWEQAALIGVESLWLTSTVCPNGTVSAPKDLSAICSA